MIAILLGIVGCYVLAAAVIYASSVIRRGRERKAKHYVLIAGNEGQRMEWYMRSLHRFSHRTGTDVKVTVVDNGSADETLRIAQVFAKRGMDVNVRASEDTEGMAGVAGKETEITAGVKQEAGIADLLAGGADEAEEVVGSGKWKRLRAIWRWRVGDAAAEEQGDSQSKRIAKPVEPTHLLWMLQAEGIVSAKEHAVLIDLRDPADLSKLPM